MWTRHAAASRFTPTVILIGALVCLAAISSRAQQLASDLPGQRLDTGLFTAFGGNELAVTVTDVGAPEVVSFVRIRVLNNTERVLATADRSLKRGQPARLVLPLSRDIDRTLLRVSIEITGTPGRLSSPIVGVEELDPLSRTIVVRGLCAPGGGHVDPVTPMCPGWEITDIAAPQ